MRVLLLSPPYVAEYMRNARCDFVSLSATQWYPILLGYCGAYLEKLGHEVKLIDAPAHYLDHSMTKNEVFHFNPDMIVLYTGVQSEDNDIQFADSLIEEIGCDCVIAGPYGSIDPVSLISKSHHINKLIRGEFEEAIAELLSGVRLNDIKNLVYRENEKIIENPQRELMTGQQLDDIPFVSRFFKNHVDIMRYKTISEPYPFIDIMTGRGCKWGQCTYCLWVHTYIRGSHYSVRSIENVMEEFRYISTDMPYIKSVMIQDDTFTEDRALEFCQAKMDSGIKLPWSCYARANMSLDVLKKMKNAGCTNIHVGYESADSDVLKNIKKGITKERMTRFTKDAHLAGLKIHGDFAFGFPGESMDSALETIKWVKQLKPYSAQFQLMIPFKGTPFYEEMNEKGFLDKNGQPDLPDFNNSEIRGVAKKAYRSFYLNPNYAFKCLGSPNKLIFSRLKTIKRAIPAMFWKKWQV